MYKFMTLEDAALIIIRLAREGGFDSAANVHSIGKMARNPEVPCEIITK